MAFCLPGSLRENGTQEKAKSIISGWSNSHLGLVLHRVLGNVTKRVSTLIPKSGPTISSFDINHHFNDRINLLSSRVMKTSSTHTGWNAY
jgi:hypothetical protein